MAQWFQGHSHCLRRYSYDAGKGEASSLPRFDVIYITAHLSAPRTALPLDAMSLLRGKLHYTMDFETQPSYAEAKKDPKHNSDVSVVSICSWNLTSAKHFIIFTRYVFLGPKWITRCRHC